MIFDFKFFIIRDLYFFYYQNIPMKYLLKRMFLIGCGLLVAFVLGILSTYVLWLEPFAVALVAFPADSCCDYSIFLNQVACFCDAFCHGNEHAAANRSITDRLTLFFMGVVLPDCGSDYKITGFTA